MLLIYLVAIPNAVPTHSRHWRYTFQGSTEDIVLLSLLRCLAITLAHSVGAGPRFQRSAARLVCCLCVLACVPASNQPNCFCRPPVASLLTALLLLLLLLLLLGVCAGHTC